MSNILSKIESFRDSHKRKEIISNFTDSNLLKSEKLKGGLADNKSYSDIAEKHKVSLDHIKSQVKIGIQVEKEHSSDLKKVIEIVKDHLMESPDYYTHLKEMEKDFEKGHKYIRRESDGKGGWNYIYKEVSNEESKYKDQSSESILKEISENFKKLIELKLGLKLDFTISIGDTSITFNDDIKISKNKIKQDFWRVDEFKHSGDWNKLTKSPLHETILHEMIHVLDNTKGSVSKFDESTTIPISMHKEWLDISRSTAPNTYASTGADEDFVASVMYYILDSKDRLTKDRLDFIKKYVDKNNIKEKNGKSEEIEIKRLSPEEEQGRIRGGSTNVEATKILRGYEISDSTEPEQIDKLISKQEDLLTKYAKKNGKWIDYDKISDKESFGGGEEANVFMNKDGVSVTKVYDYQLFSISPLEFIDNRISLHNHLFPDTAYELIGFTNNPNRGFSFIVKQPFIDGENTPTDKISEELNKMGFKDIGGNTYVSDDYIIDDLHKRNVFTKDGRLYFIDTVVSLNEEGEGYGGNRKYNKIEKAILDLLEKAWKKQPIGTISTRKDGKKYRKVSETGDMKVDWKLVTDPKQKKVEEDPSGKQKKQEEQDTKPSSKELKESAKNSSEQALQAAIKQSPEPEVRKTAHEEIDRRKKEEAVQKDQKSDKEPSIDKKENRIKDLPKGKIFDDAKSIEGVFKKSNKSWSEVIEFFEKNKDKAKIEEVSLKDIHITQPNIQSNKVENMIKDIDKTPIINAVQFKDGEISIFDGHHRLISLWSIGREKIKVNIVKEEENPYIEKFRTLSDDQIKFYLGAPYPTVKEAAKMVADERGLNILSKEDYIKQFEDYNDFNKAFDLYNPERKKISRYLDDKKNTEKEISLNTYIGYGFQAIRFYLSDPSTFDKRHKEFVATGKKLTSMSEEEIKQTSDDLSIIINDNKIDRNLSLNRRVLTGDTFFAKLKEGDIYEDKSFSSSSLTEQSKFGDFNIKILAKKGSRVANVNNIGEYEYLIDKDSKFRVIEKREDNLGITVELL